MGYLVKKGLHIFSGYSQQRTMRKSFQKVAKNDEIVLSSYHSF